MMIYCKASLRMLQCRRENDSVRVVLVGEVLVGGILVVGVLVVEVLEARETVGYIISLREGLPSVFERLQKTIRDFNHTRRYCLPWSKGHL
jgi:hypothetical protein